MSKFNLTISDYYKKADEYRKTGICEFAEALLTRLTYFLAALSKEEKNDIVGTFFAEVFSCMPDKKDNKWSELRTNL